MNTSTQTSLKKKRGPVPKLGPMVDTHVFLPEDLLEWAKQQPEGCAPLMRSLLAQERARRAPAPGSQSRAGAPVGS